MSNKIIAAIASRKQQIEKRIADGLTTAEKVAETCKALDMELDEYCMFQELKSLAVAHNLLTLEEGNTVYGFLGNTPEHFNNQSVEVKATLTGLFKELLNWKIRLARAS